MWKMGQPILPIPFIHMTLVAFKSPISVLTPPLDVLEILIAASVEIAASTKIKSLLGV